MKARTIMLTGGGVGLLLGGILIAITIFGTCAFPSATLEIIKVVGAVSGVAVFVGWMYLSIKALRSEDSLRMCLGIIGIAVWGALIAILCSFPQIKENLSIAVGWLSTVTILLALPIFSFRAILGKKLKFWEKI